MYLLFDIGGTHMRLAISRDGKNFLKTQILNTPKNFHEGMGLIKETVLELSVGRKIKAVAGGIAGPLDREKTKIIKAPNLAGWNNKPFKKSLEKISKCPVYIENDTAMAGLGEATRGAGRGYEIVVYLTLSTGLGGARIIERKIAKSAMGFEPGHQIVEANSHYSDLESQISGRALERRYKKNPAEIRNKKIWLEVTRYYAYGIHNTIVFWSPDVIVLGGGMMKAPAMKINLLKKHLEKTLTRFKKIPPIKKAQLGEVGGLYGALEFLNQSK